MTFAACQHGFSARVAPKITTVGRRQKVGGRRHLKHLPRSIQTCPPDSWPPSKSRRQPTSQAPAAEHPNMSKQLEMGSIASKYRKSTYPSSSNSPASFFRIFFFAPCRRQRRRAKNLPGPQRLQKMF
eukprot:g14786.t1